LNFLFDIDGTLTPPRQKIDPEFGKFFRKWIETHRTYLVGGSDYPKLEEQVDGGILEKVEMVFSSSGNVGHQKGQEIFRFEWNYPQDLLTYLDTVLSTNQYPIHAGRHIELRPGMINFSFIGRQCTMQQRYDYFLYDQKAQERATLCGEIMYEFPGIQASIGGQISIDIYPKGKNKPQVLKYIHGPIIFFGDKIEPGGNDHDLAMALRKSPHKIVGVRDWNHTYSVIQDF
jgi:phosphomannomutase